MPEIRRLFTVISFFSVFSLRCGNICENAKCHSYSICHSLERIISQFIFLLATFSDLFFFMLFYPTSCVQNSRPMRKNPTHFSDFARTVSMTKNSSGRRKKSRLSTCKSRVANHNFASLSRSLGHSDDSFHTKMEPNGMEGRDGADLVRWKRLIRGL